MATTGKYPQDPGPGFQYVFTPWMIRFRVEDTVVPVLAGLGRHTDQDDIAAKARAQGTSAKGPEGREDRFTNAPWRHRCQNSRFEPVRSAHRFAGRNEDSRLLRIPRCFGKQGLPGHRKMAQRRKSRDRVHRSAQISFTAQVVRRKVREEALLAEEGRLSRGTYPQRPGCLGWQQSLPPKPRIYLNHRCRRATPFRRSPAGQSRAPRSNRPTGGETNP